MKFTRILHRGINPIPAYTGRLRPKGLSFPGFGVGISLLEVYERVGKSDLSLVIGFVK